MIFDKQQDLITNLKKELPYEAVATITNNIVTISGRFETHGDWDRYLNPFTQDDVLLKAVKSFKEEYPEIKVNIKPTYDATKLSDGRIQIYYKPDDGWDAKTPMTSKTISGEISKYANVRFTKEYEQGRRLDTPFGSNYSGIQNTTKKPIPKYEDTLFKQIGELNTPTKDLFSFSNKTSLEDDRKRNGRLLDDTDDLHTL